MDEDDKGLILFSSNEPNVRLQSDLDESSDEIPYYNIYSKEDEFNQQFIFDELFEEMPFDYCRQVSEAQRLKCNLISSALAYGEITLGALRQLFILMYSRGFSPLFGGKLATIGSGVGKTLIASILLHDFRSCVGIEILSDLSSLSKKVW